MSWTKDDGAPMTAFEQLQARNLARRKIEAEFGDLRRQPWRPTPRNEAKLRGDIVWQDETHPISIVRTTFTNPWPRRCYRVLTRLVDTGDGTSVSSMLIHPRDTARN